MNTAFFKKYTESMNFDQAIENIERLTSIRATPMKYIASLELECSRSVLDSILKTGSGRAKLRLPVKISRFSSVKRAQFPSFAKKTKQKTLNNYRFPTTALKTIF